jgi:ATP-dependent RNA helicase RhlE
VPTRELAVQVADSFKAYGRGLRLGVTTLFGGAGMQPQIESLRRGTDIVVACPGRLLDHLERGTAKLDAIEVLVLDEADRMLDMGFLPAIKRVVNRVPKDRQTLLFSATFEEQIKALAMEFMRNPQQVQVAAQNTIAETIVHRAHPVDGARKRELRQVLVFTGTRIGANRLAHQLRRDHIHADAIHGDKTQAEREAALADFKSGKTSVLVATDVASRGLDIEALPQVINFDIPHSPEDYVHRIGRTGRAGMKGEAISLVAPEDAEALAAIEKLLKKRIERVLVPGFQPNAGAVAARIGREAGPGRSARPEARRRHPEKPAAPADPIFSKPYEPGTGPAAQASAPKPEPATSRRKQPQVAALLGGLKRA